MVLLCTSAVTDGEQLFGAQLKLDLRTYSLFEYRMVVQHCITTNNMLPVCYIEIVVLH